MQEVTASTIPKAKVPDSPTNFLWAVASLAWCSKLILIGHIWTSTPLYNVNNIAPPTHIIVPITFAFPLTLSNDKFSNLWTLWKRGKIKFYVASDRTRKLYKKKSHLTSNCFFFFFSESNPNRWGILYYLKETLKEIGIWTYDLK